MKTVLQLIAVTLLVFAVTPAISLAKQKPAPTPTPAMGATGPTGPTGATGATGATGPTGVDDEDRGNDNTASGSGALFTLSGATGTTAPTGTTSSPTTRTDNTAMGFDALYNDTASNNSAFGSQALSGNTTGDSNTATGFQALQTNTTGQANTANGSFALEGNTTGVHNTATGVAALTNNTTGGFNTATGSDALYFNTGSNNTATGASALQNNTTGSSNTALGFGAGVNLSTGDNNIDVGNYNPNTFLSSDVAGEANTIRIGYIDSNGNTVQTATFIAGINGVDASAGSPVYILSTGQVGTGHPPVQVGSNIRQTGARAVAELERKITAQEKTIAQLKVMMTQQQKDFTARLKEQDSKIQKVSDRVELNKPAPRTVDNNQ